MNKIIPKKEIIEIIKIAGNWIGQYTNKSDFVHSVTLNVTQNGVELFAIAVISYTVKSVHTVIQQIMNGSVNGNSITLTGVNYTYIERGKSSGFVLDTYSLSYDDQKDILSGTAKDSKGEMKFELKRLTEDEKIKK